MLDSQITQYVKTETKINHDEESPKLSAAAEPDFKSKTGDNQQTFLIPKGGKSPKLDCQLISSSNKSTAFNTNAATSQDVSQLDIGEDEEAEMDEETYLSTPFPDFDWKVQYPEEDVVDLPVEQYGETIHLKSYRWPAVGEKKAVVFYIHGYGSFASHNAVYAKYLAEAGYEVFAMDQRGFGYSEGQRAVIEKTEDIYSDQWLFIFEVIKKFKINQQTTPILLLGRSFGGLIATNMAAQAVGKAMFAGMSLITPYYHLWTEKLYNLYQIVRVLKAVKPNHIFMSEF